MQWIPVDRAMPRCPPDSIVQESKVVLVRWVWCGHVCYRTAYLSIYPPHCEDREPQWFATGHDGNELDVVTHWCPIEEPGHAD